MENFKIERKYLKLCYELRGFIRCMQAAFYRPDFQQFLIRPLIKKLDPAFASKHAAETLKHSAELLKRGVKLLKALEKTRGLVESLKSSTECLKSSTSCLCYNTAHAILISHGPFHILAKPLFTTSERELDYHHQKVNIGVAEQLKT